ncbi:MAG: DUF2510 domain-containing protein [Acidimicrobiales bacterium]
MSDSSPGWQPDPTGNHDHRYWDGSQWTDNISDAGVAGTDAFIPAATDAGELGGIDDPTVADNPAVSASETSAPAPLDPTISAAAPPPPEATAAWPATPGAPGAPAPPPPYVPTGPVGPSDGGSKKGLLIGGGILAAVVIAVIAFLALGGDDDSDGDRASNDADTTTTERDADEDGGGDGAEPAGGEEGSYGSDPELDELYDQCEDGDFQACDDLFFDSPAGSEYEDFGDTCGERNEPSGTCVSLYEEGGDSGGLTDGLTDAGELPADFEDILADTYEESLGLSREKAECLAGSLSEDIKSGELDEEEAVGAFMEYLSDCDISLEEIGGN